MCETTIHPDGGMTTVCRRSNLAGLGPSVVTDEREIGDGPPPTLLPAAAEMLRDLRRELATTLAGVAGIPSAHPIRTYRREQDDYETRIWHDGPNLVVLTCHGKPQGGMSGNSLHIAAQDGRMGWPHLQTMPDWTALGVDEAFEIAGALLGAALAVAS